VTLTIFWQ